MIKEYFISHKKRIITVIILLILIIFLMLNKKNNSLLSSTNTEEIIMIAEDIKLLSKHKVIESFGIAKSTKTIDLVSDIDGKIFEISAKEGDHLKIGDVILKVAPTTYASILLSAEAEYKSKIKHKHPPEEIAKAKAALVSAEKFAATGSIRAPFNSKLDIIPLNVGQTITKGQKLASITGTHIDTIETLISEKDIKNIEIGNLAKINIKGRTINGEVKFVSKIAADNNGMALVKIAISDENGLLYHGNTVNVEIFSNLKQCYKIQTSSLALADDGSVGIKILDQENKVSFVPIELVEHAKDFVFVAGPTTPVITVITRGHGFAKEDSIVKVQKLSS